MVLKDHSAKLTETNKKNLHLKAQKKRLYEAPKIKYQCTLYTEEVGMALIFGVDMAID